MDETSILLVEKEDRDQEILSDADVRRRWRRKALSNWESVHSCLRYHNHQPIVTPQTTEHFLPKADFK
jgi:hypothetical protein